MLQGGGGGEEEMKMNEICSARDGEGFDDARGEGEKSVYLC